MYTCLIVYMWHWPL